MANLGTVFLLLISTVTWNAYPTEQDCSEIVLRHEAQHSIDNFKKEGRLSGQQALELELNLENAPSGSRTLSAEGFQNLSENMALMGATNYDWNAEGPREWEFAFYYGIGVRVANSKPHYDLARVLLHQHKSADDLRTALNAWSTRHGIGYQFAFRQDIEQLGLAYALLGQSSPTTENVSPKNGVIAAELYHRLVLEGIFPVADPHDVLFHLSSLDDPTYRQLAKQNAQMVTDLSRMLRDLDSERPNPALKRSDLERAQELVLDHLNRTVRNSTRENWTYLVPGEGSKQNLFAQGNAPYVGFIHSILGNKRDQFIIRLLHTGYPDSSMGTEEIAQFPLIQRYCADPVGGTKYDRYARALRTHGLDRERFTQLFEKIRGFLELHDILTPIAGQPRSTLDYLTYGPINLRSIEEAHGILDQVIVFFSNDPELAIIYSEAGKKELYWSAMDFLSHYLNWVEQHPSSIQSPSNP